MSDTDIKVLVVDDEEFIQELWEEMFAILGVSIIKASSGAEGIAILQSQHVDVLVTDLKMPGSDGIELLDYISHSKIEGIKVFLCSGFLDDVEHEFSKYDIERIIPKPFRVMDEIEYFRGLLARSG